jgi:putative nucleotidyltransferase with HDIG domain
MTSSPLSTRMNSALHMAQLNVLVSTVHTLSTAIDARDDVTPRHVRRVQHGTLSLARELGVTDEDTLCGLEAAALLHDTGKIAVPEHILNKPGRLTASEFETMKRHAPIGAQILASIEFPYPVAPVVRHHHENWDGTGSPDGLKGEDIPLGARILSVVDCFDALTSDRPYRSALTHQQAFDILRARSGNMYEPRVVDTFIRVHGEIVTDLVVDPAHRQVMQQINQANADTSAPAAPAVSVPSAVPDDLLMFARLARLASGDAALTDVLQLATKLVPGVPPEATIAWYVADEQTQRLVLADASGPAANHLRDMSIGIGEGLSGWVAANRQVIVNSEAALDLGERARRITPALASCLSVPLICGDAMIGTLTLYSPVRNAFTEDQSQLLQLLAPHAAQAISRARRSTNAAEPTAASPAKAHSATASELRLVRAR